MLTAEIMDDSATHEILETLEFLTEPCSTYELRIPKTPKGTISGYYNDLQAMARDAANLSGKAAGVYFTLNPVNPDLLERSKNSYQHAHKTTTDEDIVRRHWFPIDFDAVRPAGISATDTEHQAALSKASQAQQWLTSLGFPEPIMADSGNGAHLLYRIDLPNDANIKALIEQCLTALAAKFNDATVRVDTSVHNASRLWKLYGTMVCKGEDTLERPHRKATIMKRPNTDVRLVGPSLLHTLANTLTTNERSIKPVVGKRQVRPIDNRIEEGSRNNTFTTMAGAMRRYGASEEAMTAALLIDNKERCDPPLDEAEVRYIAHSIARYEPNTNKVLSFNHYRQKSLSPSLMEGTPGTPVEVWQQREPTPRRYVIQGLVPEGAVTILYGDGGQGKSYMALYVATLACLGQTFAQRPVEQQVCLYLDAELDQDEFVRRAFQVARGLGLEKPPEGLYYHKLEAPLSDQGTQEEVAQIVQMCNASFMVFDSLTIGTYGADPSAAQDMTSVLQYLGTLGTVLAIDHISKPQPGANISGYRPFGSAFKFNLARSVIQVIGSEAGGIALRQTKHNFGARSEPICFSIDFTSQKVSFELVGAADAFMAGISDHMPAMEQVYGELLARGEEGAKPDELAETLELSVKTVKNKLTALHKQNRAEPLGDGRWHAIVRTP